MHKKNQQPCSVAKSFSAARVTDGLHIVKLGRAVIALGLALLFDRFFAASGVQLAQTQRGIFHIRHAAFSVSLKSKVGNTLDKATSLRINLNIDGVPITSRTHTHPSHSQTSRLLTSSLSLGVLIFSSRFIDY